MPALTCKKKGSSFIWPVVVVGFATVWVRLLSLGSLPEFDDAHYATWSQLIYTALASGNGIPDIGSLLIYPLMTSWLCFLPGTPLIWFRVFDLCAAAWASWLFYRIIEEESGNQYIGALLTLIVLLSLNSYDVINAGYRNSIFAAFVPLFAAFRLTQRDTLSPKLWCFVGGLVAFSVLLREPFFIFAILGGLALLVQRNWRALTRYVVGGCVVGITTITIVCFLRGGIAGFAEYYSQLGTMFANESHRVLPNFYEYSRVAMREFRVVKVLFLGCFYFVVLCFILRKSYPWLCQTFSTKPMLASYLSILNSKLQCYRFGTWQRGTFWLIAFALPMLEPLTKYGFLYHFSVCLPGAGGFCAYVWRGTQQCHRLAQKIAALVLFVLLFFIPNINPMRYWQDTFAVARTFPDVSWENIPTARSNTLIVSKILADIVPQGGTIAVSSGASYIYVASKFLPPDPSLHNLSFTYLIQNRSTHNVAALLQKYSPDAVVIGYISSTTAHASTFTEELQEAIQMSQMYSLYADVPIADNFLGWLGYLVYRKTKQ